MLFRSKAAIQKLLPEADNVITITCDEPAIKELYVATKGGSYIGSVAKVAPNGYGGEIELMVGVNDEIVITGIEILSHAETPGLGANMEKESFYTQFAGKSLGLRVDKGVAEGNAISALTGATITSQAVADGVNFAVEYIYENEAMLMKEGN